MTIKAPRRLDNKRPMRRDFFDLPWEQTNVVLINSSSLREAEQQIVSCEGCNPEGAHVLFESVLDRLTGNDMTVTDYVLVKPARCPRCQRVVQEKTGVQWVHCES